MPRKGQLVPITDTTGYQVKDVYVPEVKPGILALNPYYEAGKFSGIAPIEYAITPTQSPEQAKARYDQALNDTTTPRVDAQGNPIQPTQPASAPASTGLQVPQQQGGGLQFELYLSPDGKTVVDNNGNYVSFDDYKRITGQQNVPDKQINWSFVQKTPPSGTGLPGTPAGNPTGATGGTTSGGTEGTPSSTAPPVQLTGIPQLDDILTHLNDYLTNLEQQGKKINPNIEIDPATVQKFLDQATTEISPYYASQIKAVQDDLSRNLQTLQKSYELQKKQDEANFKQALSQKQENLAGTGLAFSGVRGQQEQQALEAENRKLEMSGLNASSQAAGAVAQAAQQIGSRNLPGLPTLNTATATTAGYTPGRNLDFYTPSTTTGSLERDQLTAIENRKNQLEEAERQRRILTT